MTLSDPVPDACRRVKEARQAFKMSQLDVASGDEKRRPIVVQIEAGKNKVSGKEARDLLMHGFAVSRDELAAYLDDDGDLVRFARASTLPQAKAWLTRGGHAALPAPTRTVDVDEAREVIIQALRERTTPAPEAVIRILESMAAKPAGPTAVEDWERAAWAIWRAHSRPEPANEPDSEPENDERIDVSPERLDELTKPKKRGGKR